MYIAPPVSPSKHQYYFDNMPGSGYKGWRAQVWVDKDRSGTMQLFMTHVGHRSDDNVLVKSSIENMRATLLQHGVNIPFDYESHKPIEE